MEERVADLDIQLKIATSRLERVEDELSAHKGRVAELEQQLKKATSHPKELSSHVQV